MIPCSSFSFTLAQTSKALATSLSDLAFFVSFVTLFSIDSISARINSELITSISPFGSTAPCT
jgi:hypothetical protein